MKPTEPKSRAAQAKARSSSERPDGPVPEAVRREHNRFSIELEVSVTSENNLYSGLAENLSAGGLFIATHKPQTVGSKIELSLRMPDSEEEFAIEGEVRWLRVYNDNSDTPPGFGVRFLELPPGAAAAIECFLGQREPLFFDDE